MKQSTVGAGNLTSNAVTSNSNMRTSSSLLLNNEVQDKFEELKACAERLQSRAYNLLQGDLLGPWGPPGSLPRFKQYSFEGLQVAEYKTGQYFKQHEDAFPLDIAQENKFQRHATVLLYLNNVSTGGATKFEHLNLAVQPEAGKVLVFFPAMADGTPDQRTLHTAVDAQDTKWVSQQWVARGYNERKIREEKAKQDNVLDSFARSRKKKQKPKSARAKGFG